MPKNNELSGLLSDLDSIEKESYALQSIGSLLAWDDAVNLPSKAVSERSEQEALISVRLHELLTSKRLVGIIGHLSKKPLYDKLSDIDKKRVGLYNWKFGKILNVPKEHVEEYTRTLSVAHHAWEEARKNESFKDFVPYLKKIFDLKKKEAKYIDPKANPYELFLDCYERGMTIKDLDMLFSQLKPELLQIIRKVKASKDYSRINSRKPEDLGEFDTGAQWDICSDMSNRILEEKDRFMMSKSTHPFSATISANDLRITTNMRNDPFFSFGSAVHESGHALFELNFDPKIYGTIFTSEGAVGLGLHESQSRFWENMICKSESFWKGYYPIYQKRFPQLKNVSMKDFYTSMNISEPSLVRIESDELTYGMHIIIRYEIEKGIFDGTIKVENLEQEWNRRYKEYLGVMPDRPSKGVLQDSHWGDGNIGYFPTYILGSIYSAMIYDAIKKDNPQVEKDIERLDFTYVKGWLKDHIQRYGGTKMTKEIIKDSCGKELDVKSFVDYLKEKYYGIYGIETVKNRSIKD